MHHQFMNLMIILVIVQSAIGVQYLKKRRENEMELSNCCYAQPLIDTYKTLGVCSECKENASFYEASDEENK